MTDHEEDNLFTTHDKKHRLLSLPNFGWSYHEMAKSEYVLGPGGQLQSFSAVFSIRGTNGHPYSWYDLESGKIDKKVTKSWEPFDISHKLEKNWKTLGPKLKGKMHFAIHEKDVFLLDHSIRLLEARCKKLESDATFTYFKGIGHHMPLEHADKLMQSVLKKWNEK